MFLIKMWRIVSWRDSSARSKPQLAGDYGVAEIELERDGSGAGRGVSGWAEGTSTTTNFSECRLLYNLEAGFFNHRIGEHFFCDAVKLLHSFFLRQAFDIQDKKFPLPNVFDGLIAQPRERMLNRLSLRIEYRALRHHPNVCFHALSITSRESRMDLQGGGSGSRSVSDSNVVNFSE